MHYMELAYTGTPADITASTAITIPDIYINPLVDYILYRALSKESAAGQPDKGAQYYASFVRSLGGKSMAEKENKKKDAADAV